MADSDQIGTEGIPGSSAFEGIPGEAEFRDTRPAGGAPAAGTARDLGYKVREGAYKRADSRLGRVTGIIEDAAERMERAAGEDQGPERQLLDRVASALHSVSRQMEGKSSEELIREARDQVREHPTRFILGCLALGFVAGRVIKE